MIRNRYELKEDYVVIYLDRKNEESLECLIDYDDFEKLKGFEWKWTPCYYKGSQSYYAKANVYFDVGKSRKSKKFICLHQYIIEANSKVCIDHINHNTLDNRKCNLRIIDKSSNCSNRKGANSNSGTGVRNVNYGTNHEVYWVQFSKKGVRYKWEFPLSQFTEACAFADIKRKEIFGDFAGNG